MFRGVRFAAKSMAHSKRTLDVPPVRAVPQKFDEGRVVRLHTLRRLSEINREKASNFRGIDFTFCGIPMVDEMLRAGHDMRVKKMRVGPEGRWRNCRGSRLKMCWQWWQLGSTC